jgi:NADPH:quinone reductase-like Zn-dependent oxidoreductase
MRVWEQQGPGLENLKLVEKPDPKPGAGEIVVAMKAASVNFRDTAVISGGSRPVLPLIPFSDGAGVVEAVGAGVTHVKAGDRVCPNFFLQYWIDGPITPAKRGKALGGGDVNGVLQEKLLISGEGVTKFPDHLSFEEAATLPCAALTAWTAMVVEAPVNKGDTMLVQGTGGVSIFALQFAKARGATVIATSSSDEKLERVKKLGADHLINYKTTPEWGKAVQEITNKKGVDVVVEVGGGATLPQSFAATRIGGSIPLIGLVSGGQTTFPVAAFFSRGLHMIGIGVGSRSSFEDMMKSIDAWKLKPVIDSTFAFEDAPGAVKRLISGQHFGKVCVKF